MIGLRRGFMRSFLWHWDYNIQTTSLRGTKTTDRRELINANENKHNINNLYAIQSE
ncbi:hypothetical protein SAMN05428975_4775 [Mucilaginibacter sp. OK268]|nr:hypothetical protein SAMN05428975_4775 [Mucilaginibacter sp. OK268]